MESEKLLKNQPPEYHTYEQGLKSYLFSFLLVYGYCDWYLGSDLEILVYFYWALGILAFICAVGCVVLLKPSEEIAREESNTILAVMDNTDIRYTDRFRALCKLLDSNDITSEQFERHVSKLERADWDIT